MIFTAAAVSLLPVVFRSLLYIVPFSSVYENLEFGDVLLSERHVEKLSDNLISIFICRPYLVFLCYSFPLYSKGKEKFQFNYGVYLLNKNIAQVRILFLSQVLLQLLATRYSKIMNALY